MEFKYEGSTSYSYADDLPCAINLYIVLSVIGSILATPLVLVCCIPTIISLKKVMVTLCMWDTVAVLPTSIDKKSWIYEENPGKCIGIKAYDTIVYSILSHIISAEHHTVKQHFSAYCIV